MPISAPHFGQIILVNTQPGESYQQRATQRQAELVANRIPHRSEGGAATATRQENPLVLSLQRDDFIRTTKEDGTETQTKVIPIQKTGENPFSLAIILTDDRPPSSDLSGIGLLEQMRRQAPNGTSEEQLAILALQHAENYNLTPTLPNPDNAKLQQWIQDTLDTTLHA